MSDGSERELMVLSLSRPRALFGVGVTVTLGVLLGAMALFTPPTNILLLLLIAGLALAVLFAAYRMIVALNEVVVLTETQLQTGAGRVICQLSDVQTVDRGALAFKPAGGFLITLSKPAQKAWMPGLWWRLGRRVGVGGTVNPGQARAMAEMITAMVKNET